MGNIKPNISLLSEYSIKQISNHNHIKYVLGIDVPITESVIGYDNKIINEIVEKQLILENFLKSLKNYLKDKYNTVVDTIKSPVDIFILIKNLITNPDALKAVYNTYRSKVDNYKKTFEETLLILSNGIESITEKLTKIPKEEFELLGTTIQIEIDNYKGIVDKIKKYFNGVVDYINNQISNDWLGLVKSIVVKGVLGYVVDKVGLYIKKFTTIIDWVDKPKQTLKNLVDKKLKSELDSGLDSSIAEVFEGLKGLTTKSLGSIQGFFKDIMGGKVWLWKHIVKFLSKVAQEVKSMIKKVGNFDLTHYGRMERDLKKIQDSYLRGLINNLLIEEMNKYKKDDIYSKNKIMSRNIKRVIKNKLNTLLETKGFEHMEVAFGVREKSDNLSDAEKKQFGDWETIQDEKGVKLGDSSVQPDLNKVHKDAKKDADNYYGEVSKKMKAFQKSSESKPSQIGEAFTPPKVNREDNQLEPEEMYSTEAMGPGMLALKYDNQGTPIHKKFEERMEDMNGDDLTYKKLKGYSEKYKKHKYEKPSEYQKTPKVRVTNESKSIDNEEKKVVKAKQNGDKSYSVEYSDGTKNKIHVSHDDWDKIHGKYGEIKEYSDVITENIFKVKNTIKSREQVLNLVDKLPSRVKIDETEFAVTDGENYYKLIWEGSEDGEAIIINEMNTKKVNEDIKKMKDLYNFKSSDKTSKNLKEGKEDVFLKLMNRTRNK